MIRVLIADDSAFMRKVLSDLFNGAPDFEVAGVAFNGKDAVDKVLRLKPDLLTMDVNMPVMDGLQALALARKNPYALVLMDMQMPRLNGVEATKAIRAESLNSTTPILAMTANAFDEDRQICLAAGMNDHIAKPVDPQRLFETLLAWLERGSVSEVADKHE